MGQEMHPDLHPVHSSILEALCTPSWGGGNTVDMPEYMYIM